MIPPSIPLAFDPSDLSLYRWEKHPYYIFTHDYRHSSAGIRCMHYLCHALNSLGQEAYIAHAEKSSPYLRAPLLTGEIMRHHHNSGRLPIGVYPEVLAGNPLQLPVIARWLLNIPGHLDGDSHYPPEELVFYYNSWCLPDGMSGFELHMPSVDRRIFNNDNNPHDRRRSIECYYANKYLGFGGKVADVHLDKVSLCHNIPRNPEDIAQILRRSRVLYCYEQSAIIQEALSCGCPVLLVRSEFWPLDEGDPHLQHPGVAVAGEKGDLDKALSTLGELSPIFADRHLTTWKQVARFIELTQSKAISLEAPLRRHSASGSMRYWSLAAGSRQATEREYANELSKSHIPSICRLGTDWPLPAVLPQAVFNLTAPEQRLIQEALPDALALPRFQLLLIHDTDDQESLVNSLVSLQSLTYPNLSIHLITPQPSPTGGLEGRLTWHEARENPWLVANHLLAGSAAEWSGFMRAGDSLSPHTLEMFARCILDQPQLQAIYCDEDRIDEAGQTIDTQLKPAFDLERLRASAYIGGLLIARRTLWMEIGGWCPLPSGLDELDVALRLAERVTHTQFGHLAGAFYHRAKNDSATVNFRTFSDIHQRIVIEHLRRSNVDALVNAGPQPDALHIQYALPAAPLLSIIIPSKDNAPGLRSCLSSLLELNSYTNIEIIVIDNSSQPESLDWLDALCMSMPRQLHRIRHNAPGNLAAQFNAGVAAARGELVLLLHDDVTVAYQFSIENLIALATQTHVGAATGLMTDRSGKHIYPDIAPMQVGVTTRPPEQYQEIQPRHRVSALPSACLMIRRALYAELGGMDAESFPNGSADMDFSLKISAAGLAMYWTPDAPFIHDSDHTFRGNERDSLTLLEKWGKSLLTAPSVNPFYAFDRWPLCLETDPAFAHDPLFWLPAPKVFAIASSQGEIVQRRIATTVESAHAAGHIRGRIYPGFPAPSVLQRLSTETVFTAHTDDPGLLDLLTTYRQQLGCRIVMDIDNLLAETPIEISTTTELHAWLAACLRAVTPHVDLLTTSDNEAALLIEALGHPARIVPPALPSPRTAVNYPRRATTQKFRIACCIDTENTQDTELIDQLIRDLGEDIEWVLLGVIPLSLKKRVHAFYRSRTSAEMPSHLAGLSLDLSLMFPSSSYRSRQAFAHRLLAFTAQGIPVISLAASPLLPHLPVTTVASSSPEEWANAIRQQISERQNAPSPRTTSTRGEAEKYCFIEHHLEAWLAAWQPHGR